MEFNGTTGQLSGEADTMTCSTNDGAGTWTALTNADAAATDGYFAVAPLFSGTTSAMNIKLDFGTRYNSASTSWVNDTSSTTQYSASSTTISQTTNGYGAGDLNSITVGTDGAITGQYSNGQVIPLFRVVLYKFNNEQGLYKVGGNLFSETRLSGEKIPGNPGENGLGSISPNSLEQSNTDIATEFVRMITTQRGFQANSKVITTTDQMLADLINLKR
jgi:flagellar hook protein FlgE